MGNTRNTRQHPVTRLVKNTEDKENSRERLERDAFLMLLSNC